METTLNPTENRIKVKVKNTGQIGTIPESKFNAIVFDRLDEKSISQVTPAFPTSKISPPEKIIQPDIPYVPSALEPTVRTLAKVGEFLGIGEAGKTISAQAFKLTPEYRDLENLKTEGKIGEEEFKNLTSTGIPKERVLASFGLLALNLISPTIIGKAKTGLDLFARTATTGAAMGGAEAIRKGETQPIEIAKQAAITGGISAALPVIGKGISKGIAATTKTLASLFSGVPKEAINYAVKNPGSTLTSINEAVKNPKSFNAVVDAVEDAYSNLVKRNSEKFKVAFQKLIPKYANTPITLKEAVSNFTDDLEQIGITKTKGMLNFSSSPLDETEERLVNKVYELVKNTSNLSLEGANNLKRKITTFYSANKSRTYQSIISGIRKRIDNAIVAVAPEMKSLNKNFAEISDLAEILQKEFRIGKSSPRAVLNSVRRAFTENNELGLSLLKELEDVGGEDISKLLIGHYFKEFFPTGIIGRTLSTLVFGASSYAAPIITGLAPLASPRVVGTTASRIGQAGQAMKFLTEKVGSSGGVGRTTLINLANRLQRGE